MTRSILNLKILAGLIVLLGHASSDLRAHEDSRELFAFSDSDAARQWQTVNDVVMGGRSDGRFQITDDQTLKFFGTLSLENNGGFASVRSTRGNLGLSADDVIVAKVRGDGRQYSMNLYTPNRFAAFSYRANFDTEPGEWVEIIIPLDQFVATSFGRVVRNSPLIPAEVNGFGILLGDKNPGSFQLEIESVSVRSNND